MSKRRKKVKPVCIPKYDEPEEDEEELEPPVVEKCDDEPDRTVQLAAKLKEFKSIAAPEPFVLKCLQNSIIDEISCNSSAIAGAVAPRVKVRRYLKGLDLERADPDYIKELFAQRHATELAFSSASEGVPLTVEFIKELHRIIIDDLYPNGGEFRTRRVMLPGCPKEPSLPEDIEIRLRALLESRLLNDRDIPIWERVERFHLEFEDIHPFNEGNGRIGFLLIAYQLIQEGYPPAEIFYPDCVEYYRAFDVYYLQKDDTAMMNFFIRIIERSVDRYLEVYRRYNENMNSVKRLNRRKRRKVASR